MGQNTEDEDILRREANLRKWFVRGSDLMQQTIDGLDIGWGGIQRWATARMPSLGSGIHLDIACGYATFLAQLGWRFPQARLMGLNIDFRGPHALARNLLNAAEVKVVLMQADARTMPLADATFDSVSCFLGMQDVEIGFGEAGVRQMLVEVLRVLRTRGILVLLDVYAVKRFKALLDGLPVMFIDAAERELDVRWSRQVAMRAAELYAEGWVNQMRLQVEDRTTRQVIYQNVLERLKSEIEVQLACQGYYIPSGPVRLIVVEKLNTA